MKKQAKKKTLESAVAEMLEEWGIEQTPNEFFFGSFGCPGAIEIVLLGLLQKTGKIDAGEIGFASEVIEWLFNLIIATNSEYDEKDEAAVRRAKLELEALKRLVRPEMYSVSDDLIRKLASKDMSPQHARAYELRYIMADLSGALRTARVEDEMKPSCEVILSPNSDRTAAYKLAQKYWRRGSTLQSIAFKVYRERLEGQGVVISRTDAQWVKDCLRDLSELKKWECENPGKARTASLWLGNGLFKDLSWPSPWFSQEWKDRRIPKGSGAEK